MTPNQRRPGVTQCKVWLDGALWEAAKSKAADRGTTITAVIRETLERFVTSTDRKPQL